MRFFLLIWVSVRLMASAEHPALLAPLPTPMPGQVNAFLSEFGGLCSAPMPSYQRFPFSLLAWHPASPFQVFVQRIHPPFSQPSAQGSANRAGFFMPGATSGTANSGIQMSCLHSFPHTLDTSSIFTRSNVHRLQINRVKRKKNQKHSANLQRKKHHKNLAILTAELQLEQRFYTFGEDFVTY